MWLIKKKKKKEVNLKRIKSPLLPPSICNPSHLTVEDDTWQLVHPSVSSAFHRIDHMGATRLSSGHLCVGATMVSSSRPRSRVLDFCNTVTILLYLCSNRIYEPGRPLPLPLCLYLSRFIEPDRRPPLHKSHFDRMNV